MKSEIERRFKSNLARVGTLVEIYEQRTRGRGGASSPSTDVLRNAVVFLHATVEELVRGTLEWKLPSAAHEHLALVPLVDCDKGGREPWCDLSDLARHRGASVDALLAKSVSAHLADATFNHPGQLAGALSMIGLDPTATIDPYKLDLRAMMQRRHLIVHRADRPQLLAPSRHKTKRISTRLVRLWYDAVRDFGATLLGAMARESEET